MPTGTIQVKVSHAYTAIAIWMLIDQVVFAMNSLVGSVSVRIDEEISSIETVPFPLFVR
jgi:hypothetical protein